MNWIALANVSGATLTYTDSNVTCGITTQYRVTEVQSLIVSNVDSELIVCSDPSDPFGAGCDLIDIAAAGLAHPTICITAKGGNLSGESVTQADFIYVSDPSSTDYQKWIWTDGTYDWEFFCGAGSWLLNNSNGYSDNNNPAGGFPNVVLNNNTTASGACAISFLSLSEDQAIKNYQREIDKLNI